MPPQRPAVVSELDRLRLSESILTHQNFILRAQEQRRVLEHAQRDSEERNRLLVLEVYDRLGLRPGVDRIDVSTGRILYGEAPAHPEEAWADACPAGADQR